MRLLAHERLRNLNVPSRYDVKIEIAPDHETDAVLYGQLVMLALLAVVLLVAVMVA